MKKIIIFILIISTNFIQAQFSADVDGKVNISPVNGNMQYVYPISNTTIDGHPLEVDMIYNSNVTFVAFDKHYEWTDSSVNSKKDTWGKLACSMPVWILGVNGFAVQVLHDVSTFHSSPLRDFDNIDEFKDGNKPFYLKNYSNLPNVNFSYWNFNWLIEGYDFCNSLDLPDNPYFQDAIKLLRSDGSVLELRNSIVNKNPINSLPYDYYDDSLYTGVYYENSLNTNSVAIVEFDESKNWPEYIKRKIFNEGGANVGLIKPRVLKYYSGDGLEYVFREYVNPYGNREDFYFYTGPKNNEGEYVIQNPKLPKPTIFYLEEINSSMVNLTKFERKYHNHINTSNNVEIYRGRSPIKEFANHTVNFSNNEFTITTFGRKYAFKIDKYRPVDFENILNISPTDRYNKNVEFIEDYFPNFNMFSRVPYKTKESEFLQPSEDDVKDYIDDVFPVGSNTSLGFYLIKEIVDPMNRATSISYGSNPFYFSASEFNNLNVFPSVSARTFERAYISEIQNPNEMYRFDYHLGDNRIKENSMEDGTIDNDAFSSVEKLEILDYKFSSQPELLKTIQYTFDKDTNNIYFRIARILTVDHQKANEKLDSIFYKNHKVAPLRKNQIQTYKTPDLDFTYPAKSVSISGNYQQINEVEYKNIYQLDDITPVTSNLYFYPYTERTLYRESASQDWLVLNSSKYIYEFQKVENYEMSNFTSNKKGTDLYSLSQGYGWLPSKVTQNIYRPNTWNYHDDSIIYKNIVQFIHLPIEYQKSISKSMYVWNRKLSLENISHEENTGSLEMNPNVYESVTQSYTGNVPPIYNLIEQQYVQHVEVNDGQVQEKVLGGKINEYNTDSQLGPGNPSSRRGALLSDKIIGFGGEIKENNTYTYKNNGGWYRNFLSGSINNSGIESKLYYDYQDLPGHSYVGPQGKILFNSENIGAHFFRKVFNQFEAPIATQRNIRKYVPDLTIPNTIVEKTDTLFNLFQRGYYGQIVGMTNNNDWFYKTEYDKNGRVVYEWHPFDFPESPLETQATDNSDECIPFYSSEIKETITNYIVSTTGHFNIVDRNTNYYSDNFNLEMGTKNQSKSLRDLPDSLIGNQAIITSEKSLNLIYMPRSADPLHNGGEVSELKLKLTLLETNDLCMPLHVVIPEINFEKIIFLDCDVFKLDTGYCNVEFGNYSKPEIVIDLSDAIPFFQSLTPDVPYSVSMFTSANDGTVKIANLFEEFSPCLSVKTFKWSRDFDDFTFRHDYDDLNRKITSYAKIDDGVINDYNAMQNVFPHSYNENWTSTLNCDGRYTGSVNFYKAFNFNYKTHFLIGDPLNPTRTDEVSRFFNNEYDEDQEPTGNIVFQIIDQMGYTINTHYKENGEIDYITNNDFTKKMFGSTILRPNLAQYPSEDYFGFCRLEEIWNEEDQVVKNYYDALGQLRQTVNSIGITKYEYDVRGNLTKVTNPEGQITNYEYDNFGNLTKTEQVDVGTTRFKYDPLGNLRFKQDSEQYSQYKLSFFEYDDLGRTTIVGEAKFAGTINFSELRGDYLSIPNYESYILNSNPTLFLEDAAVMQNMNCILLKSDNPNDYFDKFLARHSSNFQSLDFHNSSPIQKENYNGSQIMNTIDFNEEVYLSNVDINNFEDISKYPQFVKSATWYDDFPERKGPIWSFIPPKSIWENLSPRQALQNLKGESAVIAYKEKLEDPFNYVVMTYDARGRIEAIMRWTENIGFDMVHYTYNSMNKVLSVTAIDMNKQYRVWNEYDGNGRLAKVTTAQGEAGTGLYKNGDYQFPAPLDKPNDHDVEYEYNKRNSVVKISYPNLGEDGYEKNIIYNPRGWVESMNIKKVGSLPEIFSQTFNRNKIGNITTQVSKHKDRPQLTQNYTYDAVNRLTNWTTSDSKSESFQYDLIGNRTMKTVNTNEIHSYGFDPNNINNQLRSVEFTVNNDVFNTAYTYTPTGQIFEKIKTRNTTFTVTSESYGYNRSGQLITYKKQNLDGFGSSFYNELVQNGNTTLDATGWEWVYKYNYAGQREQKRLKKSPHGDDGTETQSFAHNWEYYMNGAYGEELIEYTGFQTVKGAGGDVGRRVYLSVNKFNATSELHIRRDGIKEVYFTDNNGQVRVVIDNNDAIVKKYDYKPFGGLYWSSDGSHLREGLEGSIYDPESDLQMMGFRMYDTETGRFTTPDLLWSAFPSHTPYHYAYNSPLIFSDPSGLAPEKEKDREELMNFEIDWERVNAAYSALDFENGSRSRKKASGYCSESNLIMDDLMSKGFSYSEALDMLLHGSRTGSGGSIIGLTDEQKAHVESKINVNIGSGVGNGDVIKQNFWNSFWEVNSNMTKKQYEFCTSGNITVDLVSDSEFAAKSSSNGKPTATGWHSGVRGKSTITLKASMFASSSINDFYFGHWAYNPNINGPKIIHIEKINRVEVIQHEFGHAFAYYLFGDDYNTWDYDYKENWAIWYVNETYRKQNSKPFEIFHSTWWGDTKNFFGIEKYQGRNPNGNIP